MRPVHARFRARFTHAVEAPKAEYVPRPVPIKTDVLIGAHYCPLWKEGTRSNGWGPILGYPQRKPALGWYDEGDPEVADWEIKWCLEHGIGFFVYCWYRTNQGRGVQVRLGHAIHEGLFRAKYRSKFRFCIMWENQAKGDAGVASKADLLETLLPFWIEKYFKHPSYLKVDGKPLLFIYRPEYLVDDLGTVADVRSALNKMRAACRRAGFAGLTILGEYRGTAVSRLRLLASLGLDYSFAYAWPLPGDPSPNLAVRMQEELWRKRRTLDVLPEVLTVSMGWDSRPWHPSNTRWRLTPKAFGQACIRAREMMKSQPAGSLGRHILLLDNWNEFGEGHYIAPHRQYGFGYLDAVRSVFSKAPADHLDLIPADVGLGPYQEFFDAAQKKREQLRRLCALRPASAPGSTARGLAAWWRFDEEPGTPVAFDSSGNGLGGVLDRMRRGPGRFGTALVCEGGSVSVSASPLLAPARITVECWVWASRSGQSDKWFINSVFSRATDAGFRLGVTGGRLCWAVPLTPWSHHLTANRPLPVGRWVHVAGVCDGKALRLYMDGEPCGAMPRSGPVRDPDAPLCLGNYAKGHRAFFRGRLDEVRIYERVLSEDEIRAHAHGTEP